jgi:copper chaperone CopZ
MTSKTSLALVALAALAGAGALAVKTQTAATAQQVGRQVPDTATVRLHISGMTCGTCPITARTALRNLPGVFSAAVTLQDSLGVVRYDPRNLTPAQIAAHLTRLTGYGARVIADTTKAARQRGE